MYSLTTASGVSGCLTCMRALIPRGATLVVANTVYYEVAVRLITEAKLREWTLVSLDLSDVGTALSTIAEIPERGQVVLWLDQPANWWLEAADLRSLAAAVKERGGLVIVDTSVHPGVPALRQGADVVVISLSKYPSNGTTLAGLLLTESLDVFDRIQRTRAFDASALSAESAFEVEKQLPSFVDRFAEVSRKAARLADFCSRLPGVRKVRYPNASALETENGGGVLVLELKDPSRGAVAEEIIAQNRHRSEFALNLQCTFGAQRSSFEHFHQRGTANDDVFGSLIRQLPDNFCRVGVGNEPFENIRDSLALVFPDGD